MITAIRFRLKGRDIAGHKLKLITGRRYLALRPFPSADVYGRFDVPIADITEGPARFDAPAAVVTGLDVPAAARLRNRFNECPVGGRVW